MTYRDQAAAMRRTTILPARRRAPALDVLLAFLAVGALGATVLADLPVRTSAFAASDLKTLYAAAWCFRHGLNAYSFASMGHVFAAQGVALPARWYGHAPVYPPPTLALLTPLTLLPMAAACWVETVGSLVLMALAVAALLRAGAVEFGLSLPWRMGVAAACAAGPLFAFALGVGNLSVVAAALAILAFLWRRRGPILWPGALLCLAVLLKPHLAMWVLAALLALPERRGRRVAFAALLGALGVGAALTLALGAHHPGAQMTAFFTMVRAETEPGGSMFPGSHEALPVVAQITSLASLLGFWATAPVAQLGGLAVLGVGLAILLRLTPRARGEGPATVAVAAWGAFGMLMTYHRAHDAILLLVLAPWLAYRLRRAPRDPRVWAILALYAALSVGPAPGGTGVQTLPGTLRGFLLARQAGLVALPLFGVLLLTLRDEVGPAIGTNVAGDTRSLEERTPAVALRSL